MTEDNPGEKRMGQKTKMFVAITLIGAVGFLLGVAGNFLSNEVLPALIKVFPTLLSATWMIWGLLGAVLAVVSCLIYAYLP